MIKQTLTPSQAKQKLQQYCAYQERCHREVQEKLHSYGIYNSDAAEIISDLIENNYLNEERFAVHFAGGKCRIKQWGKIKIGYALRQKGVSDYCIQKALKAIDINDYRKTFFKLAEEKIKSIKGEKNIFIRKRKLKDYLVMKGYESGLVNEVVNNL
jgi:regulatory protein